MAAGHLEPQLPRLPDAPDCGLYASRLFHFARFLQQLDMESNGKSTHVDGRCPVRRSAGPIVWGGLGIERPRTTSAAARASTRYRSTFIGVRSTEDTPLPLAAEHHRVALAQTCRRRRRRPQGFGRDEGRYRLRRARRCAPRACRRIRAARAAAALHLPKRHCVAEPDRLWLRSGLPRTACGAMVRPLSSTSGSSGQAAIWGIRAPRTSAGPSLRRSRWRSARARADGGNRRVTMCSYHGALRTPTA